MTGNIYHNYRQNFKWGDRVRVRLFHKSVDGSEKLLGEATTGQRGAYTIKYKARLHDPELYRPNLFIRWAPPLFGGSQSRSLTTARLMTSRPRSAPMHSCPCCHF